MENSMKNKNGKLYLIYGLRIWSELAIEEAIAADDQSAVPDVVVRYGGMPDEINEKMKDIPFSQNAIMHNSNSLYFRIQNVASYFVTKDEVVIERIEGATDMQVKCFLLGSSLGFCMALKNMIAIHGGAVAKYGRGLIVTGESGAGKSTVCDSLREHGFEFISDDVCAISGNGDYMHIDLAYPQQKLCRDAAVRCGYDLSELIYINEDRDKFAIRLKDGYLPEGADFHFLFEIVISDDDEFEFKKIEGHDKLFTVIRNIYRGEGSLNMWGMPPAAMKVCATIAATADIYQIKRPKNRVVVPEIVQEIERLVKG